jgi:outer membrane protein OmpA-like peptidoglycan-associated protein
MKRHKASLLLILALVLVPLLTPGCATKKYVQQEVAGVDGRVKLVGDEVGVHKTKLGEHAQKLATLGELIGKQDARINAVDAKVDAKIEEIKALLRGRLVIKETLRTSEARFEFDKSQLTPEAKAVVDAFVRKLVEANHGLYLEIHGHTDGVGPDEYNMVLGQRRAEAVRKYLFGQYRIPLHRMEVISWGSSQPLADNATREGRAQNRRIEILVYE